LGGFTGEEASDSSGAAAASVVAVMGSEGAAGGARTDTVVGLAGAVLAWAGKCDCEQCRMVEKAERRCGDQHDIIAKK
jgi:hypothetical protein